MFATVRRYTGMDEDTAARLTGLADDIGTVIESVPGARESLLIRTREGVILVTVGIDEACLVECGRRFRAWADTHVEALQLAGEAEVWVGSASTRRAANGGEAQECG
jgi:hypothetical protein